MIDSADAMRVGRDSGASHGCWPCLNGYFRTLEQVMPDGRNRGYHKPIMIAGGYGSVRDGHVDKLPVVEGALLLVLGGPAMLIGLGGGAASSMAMMGL